MRKRCEWVDDPSYSRYGGRGITVCERWHVFQNFLDDMGERPAGMTLDRIDPNGNYEPSNCRWATSEEQGNNKRTCHYLTLHGETMTISQWARRIGMNKGTLGTRLRAGWTVEDVLSSEKICVPIFYEIDGETQTLTDWAKRYGINYRTARSRILAGMSVVDALRTPLIRKKRAA